LRLARWIFCISLLRELTILLLFQTILLLFSGHVDLEKQTIAALSTVESSLSQIHQLIALYQTFARVRPPRSPCFGFLKSIP